MRSTWIKGIRFGEVTVLLCFLCHATLEQMQYRQYYHPWNNEYYRNPWSRAPQQRHVILRRHETPQAVESTRHFSPDTLHKITETLGAINTVGRYIVNMTIGEDDVKLSNEVPSAIYTISKNVLGRNVTDTIAPLVREALPNVIETKDDEIKDKDDDNDKPSSCTTPGGLPGSCKDLSDCPQLLLNLGALRQSLCFKSLFVPGVCCPTIQGTKLKPVASSYTSTTYPSIVISSTTVRPLRLTPVTTPSRVTKPPINIPSYPNRPNLSPDLTEVPQFSNFVDPEECGQPEFAKFRVVGGQEALPGRWPWMAAIFLHGSKRTEFWCGGSLITAKHILTAAHCTRDSRQRPFAAKQFTVRLGDIDLKRNDEPSAPVTFKVSEIRVHPQFSRVGFYNDIAILVLDHPARKSKYVIPLCLPPPSALRENFAGKRTTVVGWGTTYYGGKESTVQRQAILPVWRNEDCNEAYFQPITSNFICAGYSEGGTDACQGDSGGPLMAFWDTRWIQVGVVSFGNKCGEPGYPGVYTRVTGYMNWIRENTREKL
ncbi:hypothetical protein WA026_004389 [Henosepilachna vigintioctopunctata]|uniref:Proclotting enzyme n=1 Tax=Henosepilachna vigintioctopunctata TaxID=420089 RepID=A0AAW1V207_9CUCU